jgi:hypothetical protein
MVFNQQNAENEIAGLGALWESTSNDRDLRDVRREIMRIIRRRESVLDRQQPDYSQGFKIYDDAHGPNKRGNLIYETVMPWNNKLGRIMTKPERDQIYDDDTPRVNELLSIE